MQRCCRSRHRALVAGKDWLVTLVIHLINRQTSELLIKLLLQILRQGAVNILRQWCCTQRIQFLGKLLVRIIRQEAECTTAWGHIINHFGDDGRIFVKKELVADTNLAGRIYQHIPETILVIQLTQKKHFDIGIRLLFFGEETSRHHLSVVEYKSIAFGKKRKNIRHLFMLNLTCFTMEHKHTCLISIQARELSYLFFR